MTGPDWPRDLTGATAVITGGASGMGRSMAHRFGAAGCNIAIADIEEPAIDETVAALRQDGVQADGFPTDVSNGDSMDALGAGVVERFGHADIVCLNAGVGNGGPMGTLRTSDWAWVLDVNLWGVIHGIRVFLPGLEERNQGHVVITSSIAGIVSFPNMGPYNASKHAVLSIAETLQHELQVAGSGVRVSALCPGLVNTRILDSSRNRAERYRAPALEQGALGDASVREAIAEIYANALSPDVVADMVHQAVLDDTFYIVTDNAFDEQMAKRHRDIESRRNPGLDANIIETHLSGRDHTS